MKGLLPGQTPLHPDDLAELIPTHLTSQRELNEYEHHNISVAVGKYYLDGKQRDLGDPEVLKKIHFDMLGETWMWAGKFRKRDTNIGVIWSQIQIQVKEAGDDFRFWVSKKIHAPLETAIRFHHRLIAIHPFPNGNGRHGRLVADIHLIQLGMKPPAWSGGDLDKPGINREKYIQAMKQADQGNFKPLLDFAQFEP